MLHNRKNETEKLIKEKCEKYLQNLKNKGDAGVKEDALLKTFLILTGNESPSIDDNVAESISKLILDTLLPVVIKEEKNINGLENLLSEIKPLAEFDALITEAKDIAEKILSPEQFKDLHELGTNLDGFLKELSLEGCSVAIKFGLNKAIELVIERLSKPTDIKSDYH